ncbi:hypothetical protein [Faecalimicrobium dakarense]|uniref:hypothetical protein n=1 Tax=Faecalimicrobium dakarense TaxID=1301100 RepID=UPI0005AA1ADE|nr:hypothetical protein [[Clostridium] dakarense]
MEYTWLNPASIVLGLIAWMLPFINLVHQNKSNNKNWVIFSVASISACSISLCMQIFYTNHLVNIEDWTAIMDTSSAVAFASAFLLVSTIILNAITCIVYYGNKPQN